MREYAALYEKDGLRSLEHLAESDFLLHLVDKDDHELLFRPPVIHDHFNLEKVRASLNQKPFTDWQVILGEEDEDRLQVYRQRLPDGSSLQVGKSTDATEDLLEDIGKTLTIALFVTIGVAALAGMLFSKSVLTPIRDLIATIQRIDSGHIHARVPARKSGDELDRLSALFNQMLDRIQALMRTMQDTQDHVAHDLRTPITRFRSIAEIALQQPNSVDRYREALSEGLECSDEILALIQTLMEISEAEAGAIPLKILRHEILDLISEVIDLYALPMEDRGIQLTIVCEPRLAVMADRHYLKRVLSNLVDNAIKYSVPGGRIEILATAMTTTTAADASVDISVVDNGIGISQHDLPRIWDRLYRGDKSRSQAGMGLGLSLVRSVVEAHHGRVTVESVEGKGSKFMITLPLKS